jgi:asparaginyl-tRNA synthetase
MNGLALSLNKNLEVLKQTENRWRIFHTEELKALAKVESSLLKGARKYFEENDFIEVNVPHITTATGACENIATMFEINFFRKICYLAQTGQLYLEVLTPFLKKVWCIGPSFRAEPEIDDRHLCEFPLIELEFAGNFEELLTHIENVITNMIRTTVNEREPELKFLGADIDWLEEIKPKFKRITYTEAVEIIREKLEPTISWGDDLKSKHEKFLASYFGNKPLFITHFPKEIKFFNMIVDENNPKVVKSADLIMPFSGEAVGAAEREYKYEKLQMLVEKGGSIEDFNWYLDFYKTTSLPHSGCGIGFNRVTQSVLAADDIRACTVYPINRATLL